MWLVGAALTLACATPRVRPAPPALGDLGVYAAGARRSSGCWAIRSSEPDPSGDLAQLVILELDTLVVSPAGTGTTPELRAFGRAGVPRSLRDQRPAYFWHVASGRPDTVDIAMGGMSFPGWRLTPSGDSLVGRAYQFWDLGGVETDGGRVSARRVACR
jgi:hypothetical protein